MELSEDKLEQFSKQNHKKNVKQALTEGIIALLPLIALSFGFSVIYSRPNSQELLSPQRLGIVGYLFPLLIVAYFIFLFFVIRDIHKRVVEK